MVEAGDLRQHNLEERKDKDVLGEIHVAFFPRVKCIAIRPEVTVLGDLLYHLQTLSTCDSVCHCEPNLQYRTYRLMQLVIFNTANHHTSC